MLIQQGSSDVANVVLAEKFIKKISSKDKKLVTYKAAANTLVFESNPLRTKIIDFTGALPYRLERLSPSFEPEYEP